jgi:hypothetical protein
MNARGIGRGLLPGTISSLHAGTVSTTKDFIRITGLTYEVSCQELYSIRLQAANMYLPSGVEFGHRIFVVKIYTEETVVR